MTTCLEKSCSLSLPRVPFVNCCQFMYMYLVISLLVLRARYGILLCLFLIIAYLFTSRHGLRASFAYRRHLDSLADPIRVRFGPGEYVGSYGAYGPITCTV